MISNSIILRPSFICAGGNESNSDQCLGNVSMIFRFMHIHLLSLVFAELRFVVRSAREHSASTFETAEAEPSKLYEHQGLRGQFVGLSAEDSRDRQFD